MDKQNYKLAINERIDYEIILCFFFIEKRAGNKKELVTEWDYLRVVVVQTLKKQKQNSTKMDNDIAEKRLHALERLYTSPHSGNGQLEKFSTETLLDILVVLYDECNTTVMKRDKRVVDFLEVGTLFNIALFHEQDGNKYVFNHFVFFL